MKTSNILCKLGCLILLSYSTGASAQFSAGISPPRFEIDTKPSKVERRVVELANPSESPVHLSVYTNDWTLNDDGNLTFSEELKPDSCRPNVALDRKKFTLPPGAKIRYRFEVQPPAEGFNSECRFVIFFETKDSAVTAGSISAAARMGVIVYVRPDGFQMKGNLVSAKRIEVKDGYQLELDIENAGQSTIRPEGKLEGVDEKGEKIYFGVAGYPIFPGQKKTFKALPIDPMKVTQNIDVKWTGVLSLSGELRLSEANRVILPINYKIQKP